ncbi:hypothetical protein HD597_000695 [Nonomuraea thailandensis]|uniref:Peptidase S33 tripeptidyl aminopeptidase-like C-terminal domain-containing protein n=1 Tax=Nonomuraea thailandensis TaxID=1188745 RepID=A0A9X2G9R0_9ACTN|nr:alpha/beta hydrolase [Nonomuraea thailandensis]MCP2353675.1 hypothetical protein [Nonomuraea thailandensis]
MPPILIFNSESDPSTPIEGAKALRRLLPSSRLVTEMDAGKHGVVFGPLALNNPAANKIGAPSCQARCPLRMCRFPDTPSRCPRAKR